MISMKAGPFASAPLRRAKFPELLSSRKSSGSASMCPVRISMRRTGLLAVTSTVNRMSPPVTSCPSARPVTEIVGTATGFVGSNTSRMMRLELVVCPEVATMLCCLLAAIPSLEAMMSYVPEARGKA